MLSDLKDEGEQMAIKKYYEKVFFIEFQCGSLIGDSRFDYERSNMFLKNNFGFNNKNYYYYFACWSFEIEEKKCFNFKWSSCSQSI